MTVSVFDQLANALGRRDEAPNIALAEKTSKESNKKDIEELIILVHHKSTPVRHDAIKVLYEIGERKPELITPYWKDFLNLLNHKDNWMKWGAMTALSVISKIKPEFIAGHLPAILDAMDRGSVITRDHGIAILCDVASIKRYHDDCIELLLDQVQRAPVNQVPMYAEKTAEVISFPMIKQLESILRSRQDVMKIPSKQKRIEKLLKSLRKEK